MTYISASSSAVFIGFTFGLLFIGYVFGWLLSGEGKKLRTRRDKFAMFMIGLIVIVAMSAIAERVSAITIP